MCESDEIRILLKDPHEFGEIDGAWGAGIARLAEDLERDPSIRPLILTEPRLAPCIEAIRPGLPIWVSRAADACGRAAQAPRTAAAFLDLLFLGGRLPDRARAWRIRSYGLRAGLLGCVLAQKMRVPHTAMIADPFDEPLVDPRGWKLRAWIRLLETKVASQVDLVEAPDEVSAERLRGIVLRPGGERIRADRLPNGSPPTAPFGRSAVFRIAVEASTRSAASNRVALRAIRGIASGGHVRIHWLAPRSGMQTMRARQDIRRWDLARHLCWEDEPWVSPPHLRKERWNLLIRADPRPGARPLHVRVRAHGTRIIAPAAARAGATDGDIAVDWTPRSLSGLLENLAGGGERR